MRARLIALVILLLGYIGIEKGQSINPLMLLGVGPALTATASSPNIQLVSWTACQQNGSTGAINCGAATGTTIVSKAGDSDSATSHNPATDNSGDQAFTLGATCPGWYTPAGGIKIRKRAVSRASTSKFMEGVVKSCSATTLTLTVDSTGGSGAATDWTFTVPASGAGNAVIVYEADYAAAPAAASLPTDTNGDTFVADATSLTTGRDSIFSKVNIGSGNIKYTMTPNSGAASAVVTEWSGIAVASAFGTSSASSVITASAAWEGSPPNNVAGALLALGFVHDRTGGKTYSVDDNWTGSITSSQLSDGDTSGLEYIVNGFGLFSPRGTVASVATWVGGAVYKAAVAGTAPTGLLPAQHYDAENSTDTTVLTATIAGLGTHGMECTAWTIGGSIFTVATAAQQNLRGNVTVNGQTRTGSGDTRGIKYDHSNATSQVAQCTTPAGYNVITMGAYVTLHAIGATDFLSFMTFNDGGTDFADAQYIGSQAQVCLESVTGTTGSCTNVSMDTGYIIYIKYMAGGTPSPLHTMRICKQSDGTQVGSDVTRAVTGNANITSWNFGNSHATTSHAAGSYMYIDNITIDTTGTLPACS